MIKKYILCFYPALQLNCTSFSQRASAILSSQMKFQSLLPFSLLLLLCASSSSIMREQDAQRRRRSEDWSRDWNFICELRTAKTLWLKLVQFNCNCWVETQYLFFITILNCLSNLNILSWSLLLKSCLCFVIVTKVLFMFDPSTYFLILGIKLNCLP